MGRSYQRPSIWCSKYYFLFFCNFTEIKIEFWVPQVQASNPLFYFQSIKIILGPSDAWSMRRSTQRPSILYWRLSDFFYLCQTSHEGNKCRTKAKELLRAFCPNIHTVISYFIRWERRLPSSGLLNTTTGFGSLVGIVFPKAIKTSIILLIDQVVAVIFVK